MAKAKKPVTVKRKKGRPTLYSPEMVKKVCDLIATGHSLRQIASIQGMPDRQSILNWLARYPEFVGQYARARELQAEHMAEELLEIVDDARNDFMTRESENGTVEVVDHEHIARSKLRYEARRWLMSKMAPKKYGDKIDHAHSVIADIAQVMDERRRAAKSRVSGV